MQSWQIQALIRRMDNEKNESYINYGLSLVITNLDLEVVEPGPKLRVVIFLLFHPISLEE